MKTPVSESHFNKVAGLRPLTLLKKRLWPVTLLKKRLWHRCFPVNFVKSCRTAFLQNTSDETASATKKLCQREHLI